MQHHELSSNYQNDLIARTRKLLQGARNVPLSNIQQASLIDPDVKGPSWVSRTSFPAPRDESNGPRSLLESAIEALGNGKGQYTSPSTEAVDVRWTGHRPGVEEEEAEPAVSKQEKYRGLAEDSSSPLTIMFFHGGGYRLVRKTSPSLAHRRAQGF